MKWPLASAVEIIEATAHRNGVARVRAVWLEIGALSHVEPEAMRFCFGVVTRGSLADRARLEIAITPGAAWCMPCGVTVPLPALGAPCLQCGSYQLTVAQGETMRVKEIDVA